jgi:cobalt transporter subunit CbtA
MTIFRNAVFLAALAGLVAGLVMTGLQSVFTVPLILQAETYEHAHDADAAKAASPGHAATEHAATEHAATKHAATESAQAKSDEPWEPEDGLERTLFTTLANIVGGIGFGLLLVAASEIAGGIDGWHRGLIWGFAGFAVFTLAPSLGLPPELPGMEAADLMARQIWWIFTVAATAIGLALIVFRTKVAWTVLGVALIVLPHILGAPQPESHDTLVPPNLHLLFINAAILSNLVFWLVLGASVGAFRQRFAKGLAAQRPSLV